MTDLPRAATSGELAKFRADNQAAKLYLVVYQPATVYTARLAAVPTSTDQVASITHNTNSGTLSDIKEDMTLLVGSSAGARDLGIARMRKDGVTGVIADATTFNIGEESEIDWQANCYLTILDEFLLWPRHIKIASDGTTPLMDYNIAYTNQNQTVGYSPFAVMGPHRVKWLRGATITTSWNASNSWIIDQAITAYAWSFPGASATTGTTTATPTATYNAAGVYRAALTVTGANGVSDTGYRYIFIVNPNSQPTWLIDQFKMDSCEGNDQSGYWSFKVTLFAQADQSTIHDRALAILFARDWYGPTVNDEMSIGYVADVENILSWGWIDGESIDWRPPYLNGKVAFEVGSPGWWLDHIPGFPTGAKDTTTTPNKWTKFQGLTVEKSWYQWMQWRTTAHRCTDVYDLTDANRRVARLEAPGNQSIWQQLIQMAEKSILARPKCDRYGRLFLQIEQSLIPIADRSTLPTVLSITTQDWRDEVTPERIIVPPLSLLDLSGVWWDGTTGTPIFSLSNGRVYKRLGAPDVRDRLAIAGATSSDAQNVSNELCGAYLAWRNNEFPRLTIRLASNLRLLDFAPWQRATLPIASTDTILGLSETVTLVPKRIAFVHNPETGTLHTQIDFEKETIPDLAVTGDTPAAPPTPPPAPPILPPTPPPIVPPVVGDATEVWFAATGTGSTGIYWSGDYFAGGQPTWNRITTVPAGTLAWFGIAIDGSSAYMAVSSAPATIYQCTNPKAATPTWTPILTIGDTVLGATVDVILGGNLLSIGRDGATLIAGVGNPFSLLRHWAYGEYNGTAWAWKQMLTYNVFNPDAIGFNAWYINNNKLYDSSNALIETIATLDSGAPIRDLWFRPGGTHRYFLVNTSGSAPWTTALHWSVGGSQTLGLMSGVGQFQSSHVHGAEQGPQVYCVFDGNSPDNGVLWLSDNGTTFTNLVTWAPGRVFDAKLAGGGTLIWILNTMTVSNIPTRLYNRDGTVLRDMTGNLWSLATNTLTVIGAGVVYA